MPFFDCKYLKILLNFDPFTLSCLSFYFYNVLKWFMKIAVGAYDFYYQEKHVLKECLLLYGSAALLAISGKFARVYFLFVYSISVNWSKWPLIVTCTFFEIWISQLDGIFAPFWWSLLWWKTFQNSCLLSKYYHIWCFGQPLQIKMTALSETREDAQKFWQIFHSFYIKVNLHMWYGFGRFTIILCLVINKIL